MMGNRPTVKGASMGCIVLEQLIRLMIHCGMPPTDLDLIHCGGRTMGDLINKGPFRLTQFTGSSVTAEDLAHLTHGKVRLEDAGFDWKILGPDVLDIDFVSWQSDQDAYACSG